MSGGVDSSVAALLARDAGHRVAGVTMRLFDGAPDAAADARSVCVRLGIPHETLDCARAFADEVVEPFCDAYLAGLTPNPCVMCNRRIKFGQLQAFRRERGFDYVATGHYAVRERHPRTGRWAVRRALDPSKDQSYVLACATQDDLAHTLLPLGTFSKPQVRSIAREHGFLTADKPESQDICFIPDGDYAGYIARRRPGVERPGDIVDAEGTVLGTHQGLSRYTVGQRKGIGVAAGEPYYVIGKDAARNRLVVGFSAELLTCEVRGRDVNLVAAARIEDGMRVRCKTSYRQRPQPACARMDGDVLAVAFDAPQRKTAPGQYVVLYDDDGYVLAGAWAL